MMKENKRQDRSRTNKGKGIFTFPRNRMSNKPKKTKKKKKKRPNARKYVNGIAQPGSTLVIGPQTVPIPPGMPNAPPSPRLFDRVKNDPQYCVEYLPSIYRNYRVGELKYLPRINFIEDQLEITVDMRAILVDWLFDVHSKFKMQRETLFLCINILDRFLSCVKVTKRRLQLVGITALYLASKYEEIYIPSVIDLESICAHTYNSDQILKMEKMILTSLSFALTIVTPNQVLPSWFEAIQTLPNYSDERRLKAEKAAEFVSEFTLGEIDCIKYKPSQIASSSLYIGCLVAFGGDFSWNETFKYYVGYAKVELMPCVDTIVRCLEDSFEQNKLTACRRKFSTPQNLKIAKYVESRLGYFQTMDFC